MHVPEEAYINKGIEIQYSIQQERGAHQESGKGEIKWHEFNTLCLDHQILEIQVKKQ
jgi:hypothetical protein